MPILSKPSPAARWSLIYITAGALIVVWTGIWLIYLRNHEPQSHGPYYWCFGFMLTGLTLFAIGLGIGRLGRSARQAEMPPEEATPVEAQSELKAASRAPIVAPANPSAPAVAPNPSPPPNSQATGVAPVAGAPPTSQPQPNQRS